MTGEEVVVEEEEKKEDEDEDEEKEVLRHSDKCTKRCKKDIKLYSKFT